MSRRGHPPKVTIEETLTMIAATSFSRKDITEALSSGWRSFRAIPGPSVAYAGVFVLIGLALLVAVGKLGASPMALPLAGGFLLVGPALLSGFFRLSIIHANGDQPRLLDAFSAFTRVPGGVWIVSILCLFLFFIWITDAAVLYAVMIGGEHLPYQLPWLINLKGQVIAFEFWGSLMGSIIAFLILAISAFSVPLLFDGRASLVEAIQTSVRTVFANFLTSIVWGILLAGVILVSIVLLPLLLVTLPWLAYASFSLYRTVFPVS
jgi:uncharacterized membrane protein